MATIIQNKYPIDSEARKAVGFGFPLNGNAVFVPTYQTRDQIKANLINYVLTNHGERFFNPNFGANLRNLIFESITSNNIDSLKNRIEDAIRNYFPQIKVKSTEFDIKEDDNYIRFILTYEVVLFGITDSIDILLQ